MFDLSIQREETRGNPINDLVTKINCGFSETKKNHTI